MPKILILREDILKWSSLDWACFEKYFHLSLWCPGHNHNLLGSSVGLVLVMHPVNWECDHTDLTRPVSRQQLAAACHPGGNLDQSQASIAAADQSQFSLLRWWATTILLSKDLLLPPYLHLLNSLRLLTLEKHPSSRGTLNKIYSSTFGHYWLVTFDSCA